MKNTLVFKFISAGLFLIVSHLNTSYAASYQDLLDKLDDIEYQLILNEIMRSQVPTSPTNSTIRYIVKSAIGNDHLIILDTIKKNSLGNIVFTRISSSENPRYLNNRAYFTIYTTTEINCIGNSYRDLNSDFFSNSMDLVYQIKKYKDDFIYFDEKSIIYNFKKFLCR